MKNTLICIITTFTLSGCASLTQMQDSISKFDQGVHSISTSQMAYFNGAHMIECERQFYANSVLTALSEKNIDLRDNCKADEHFYLTSRQIETRKKLFNAITLYVDQLQAIASAEDNKNLDSSLQAQAKGINSVASSFGLSKDDATIANYVETAVAELTKLVIQEKKINAIKEAAKNQKDNLAKVVDAIKTENLFIAYGVYSDIGDIRSKLSVIISAIRDKQGPAVFVDFVNARTYLRSLNMFSSAPADLPDDTTTDSWGQSKDRKNPTIDPFSSVQQLNQALDGIVAANNALAGEPDAQNIKANFVSVVNNLVALAKDAEAFQKAIK